MRVAVVGAGAVGVRVARLLLSSRPDATVAVIDQQPGVAAAVARTLGVSATAEELRSGRPWQSGRGLAALDVDLVVLSAPSGVHAELAAEAIAAGLPVVSTVDAIADVRALQALDGDARTAGVPVLIGAGFAPGLTCLLSRAVADRFDRVSEVHVAKVGAGGPACARQHHRALKSAAIDWRDGAWVRRPGGSGRELCWFPAPVDGRDCYRGALGDPLVLVPAFDGVERVTARMWATRRDRLTMHLPMLRRPHPEGLEGAVRVEVRGELDGRHVVEVRGCAAPPAVGAATVAAAAVGAVLAGDAPAGAYGLAELTVAGALLASVRALGLRLAAFTGVT